MSTAKGGKTAILAITLRHSCSAPIPWRNDRSGDPHISSPASYLDECSPSPPPPMAHLAFERWDGSGGHAVAWRCFDAVIRALCLVCLLILWRTGVIINVGYARAFTRTRDALAPCVCVEIRHRGVEPYQYQGLHTTRLSKVLGIERVSFASKLSQAASNLSGLLTVHQRSPQPAPNHAK